MKRTSILVMSALALIALSVIVAFGWSASTATTWETTPVGHWLGHVSGSVQATTTTGWVRASAPVTWQHNCQWRKGYAIHVGSNQEVATAQCPNGTQFGTDKCCVNQTWIPLQFNDYRAGAAQQSNTDQACGPTKGTIQDATPPTCVFEQPGGE